MTARGAIDQDVRDREPVGDDMLHGIATAVGRVPGVVDAAAVVRRRVRRVAAPKPVPPAPARVDGAPRPPAELDGGPLTVPDGAPATLQAALRRAAETAPDKGTVFIRRDREDETQTYPELLAEAERALAGLRAAGLRPGDSALFVFGDNRAYLTAFWACVLGGFIPAPVAVAPTYRSANEPNRKLRNAWRLLGRPVVLTDAATAAGLVGVRRLWDEPDVRVLTVEELLRCPPDHAWFPATPHDPVLDLLTSGSTGVPKCVRHTNASVAARTHAVAEHCALTGDDVSLIWMPLDHVTVAMYNVRDVFLGARHINARTDHFLGDPLLWLDWMDRHRVTNTWAPNFAFSMVNERAADMAGRSWDLSCVRELVNAGEPVIASTSHRFLQLLAQHGLRPDAIVPCWGMSETCSGVTYTRQSRDDHSAGTVTLDPASLGGPVRRLRPGDAGAVVLSTVGRPIPGVRLCVVGEDGTVLPERRIGELRIDGPTMMRGYFRNDEANSGSYDENGWFRTGDLAFVDDGEVVIAGRVKDQIIVRGINYLAHELESVAGRVDGVRATFVAAAGVREPGAESDQVVIFFVPDEGSEGALPRIAEDVRSVLGREAGLAPDLLVPLGEAEFPKTASGKIQRSALVDRLRSGAFADRTITAADDPAGPGVARRQWAELPASTATADDGGVRLVLAEDEDLRWLGVDGPFVAARRGGEFAEEEPDRYRVSAADRTDLRRLLGSVAARHGRISTIVSALPLSCGGDHLARLTAATAELTALIGALGEHTGDARGGGEDGWPLVLVLTAGALHVRDGDRIDLGVCALPGLVRTAARESVGPRVRHVDLPADRGGWADGLRAELADRDRTGVVAARGRRRWRPVLVPVAESGGTTAPVVVGGRYLITGGLGGIAHGLAAHLVAAYGARLLLVGRSPAEGERGRRLAELAGLGEVRYHRADVADPGALEAAVASAEADWGGPIDGVLHLAAADPTGQWADLERHTLAREEAATFAEQYRAKVAGTLAVARVLESRPGASLVLFGSVNGEFGGHSFGAYSTANAFVTGFADHWHFERRREVRCLAWSMWTGAGMNRGRPAEPARRRGFRDIDPDEGLRLFLGALSSPHHHLLLGLDLSHPEIVEESAPDGLSAGEVVVAYTADGVRPETVRTALDPHVRGCPLPVRLVELPRIPRDAGGAVDAARLLLDAAPHGGRRTLAAPVTDLERRLVRIWSDALDRPKVGRDDSFFELGGDSLRAARLLALVDDRVAVRVTTQELYESPTVAGMAAAIERHRSTVRRRPT
ncbi:SDR family NAD(P)-dependent oxidoreductase [Actinomadura spongiicola]|uniref:SDR family NAD(P)-dependent oxidoreductase n=1 Tax=Actinomadura spongiicola TaxID=2303421 RepID=A0A372GFM9_9ACTN|nr:SDR family NAD(P)-dependent oxidoreductase [Actinomadura spongiicola]RFS84180.1 SDR family NAD(P)-dependent oxidoreductase [Actinomadura spongiicola]